jgi:hypothetical protein
VPEKLARQRDFYQFPNAPPGTNLEGFLEKVIETPGLEALWQLTGTKQPLDVKGRIYLARYIAFQEMRVPHTRELCREHTSRSIKHTLRGFEETGGTKAHIQHFALSEGIEAKRSKPISITREEVEQYAKQIANNPETFHLGDMVALANDAATFYAAMRWTILLARRPDDRGQTGRSPVSGARLCWAGL